MKRIKMALALGALALTLTACMGDQAENKPQDSMNMPVEKTEVKDDMKQESENADNKSDSEDKDKDAATETKTAQQNEGMAAPDFTVKDSDGNAWTLSEQKGKKVYLKFWASWCPACLAGLEQLDELSKDNSDFEVVSIVSPGIGGEKNKEDFMEWFSGLGHENIKVYFDEEGEAMKSYGIRAFPTSAVVGSDGILIGVQPGHLDNEILKEVFETVH